MRIGRGKLVLAVSAVGLAVAGVAGADVNPGGQPPGPQNLQVSATQTSLKLSWSPVIRAVRYDLYLDGASIGTTPSTSWTYTALTCGTTHLLEVDARDQWNRRSQRSSINGSTSPCSPGQSQPVISSFNPASGAVGTSVTLTGANFTDATAVAFNGTGATYTVNSDSKITTKLPSGATTGLISVSGPGGGANSSSPFTVSGTSPPPTVASFAPTSGAVGTSVTLTGTSFTGATAVAFNGTTAVYKVTSDTQITTTVPGAATSGLISVTGPGGTGLSPTPFTVSGGGGGGGAAYYVSLSGSDSGSCSQAKPCLSFGRAYQVASPGDTVLVGSGSYPEETVTWPSAKPAGSNCKWGAPFPLNPVAQDLSGCITFKPAAGASVTVAALSVSAPYVRLDGFTVNGGITLGWDGNAAGGNCDQQKAHDIVLSKDTLAGFDWSGVQHVYLVSSSVGPTTDASNNIQPCDPAQINNQGAYVNTDHIALIGDTIHDVTTSNPSGHIEGIHWQDTTYGYVAQSRFLNNDQQDISFHPHGAKDHLDNLLLENNVFDTPCSNHGQPCGVIGAISFGCDPGTLNGFTIRFNSYNGADTFDGGFTGGAKCSPIQSYGNILDGPMSSSQCSIESQLINYTYNMWTNNGVQCGTGNSVNNSRSVVYTDPTYPAYDYTEKPGSPSINFYSGKAFPGTDIVGNARPLGAEPDAGSYER